MLLSDAINRILDGLGFRREHTLANGRSLGATVLLRIQEAQRELEMGKSLPWFLLQRDQTLTLLSGTNTITLPTGFIREEEDEPLRYTPVDSDLSERIVRRTLWESIAAYASGDPAGPKVYVIRGTTITVQPIADRTYSLTWSYYKHDTPLESEGTNQWLTYAPEVIIGEAGYRMAWDLENEGAVKRFDTIRQAGRISLFAEQVVRDESGGPISLGSAL